ncbi:FxSxx-COOH system tetratricopeptide repeat protein [Paractinoplanes maris]|uniref:FxSxx-COOH system tetratricopeptide repeat protein n=1 Tax=Paractinoplanes maris TaxID=1734446 RepID=UPI002021B5DF|nr:FxSxx-COOH system tetratricopeptide repeat protein [Actinoplanes maris]
MITTGSTVGAASAVFGLGRLFPAWDDGWVQTATGLAAAVVAAPLCVWAGKAKSVAGKKSVTGPATWSIPILPNPEFVGREVVLDTLSARFSESAGVAVQTVQGMGGIGKTQLVAHYAHTNRAKYRIVWWIPAEDPTLIGARFAQLAVALHLARSSDDLTTSVTRVLGHLNATSGWLLIFDNAVSPSDLRSWLPSGAGHILITSRTGAWNHLGATTELREMPRGESVELVRRRHPALSRADANRLAEGLGDLPLALIQAAGFMQTSGTPVAVYLQLVEKYAGEVMHHGPVGDHDGTLTASVTMSMRQLAAGDAASLRLLQVAASLGPEPIPLTWLAGRRGSSGERPLEAELEIRASVSTFVELGLATSTNGGIQFHRLTRAVITDAIDPDVLVSVRDEARELLSSQRPASTDDSASWGQWARLIPHLLVTDPADSHDPETRRTACDATRYLLKSGQIDAGHHLATTLHEAWRVRLGEEDVDTLRAAQQLGHALRIRGEYRQAQEMDLDTANRRRRILGFDHPDSLWAASNLAVDWRQLGEYQKAEQVDQDTYDRRRRVLGESHPDTLSSASNLAVDWRQLGEHERASQLDRHTLDLRKRILGESHPDTLDSENNLAIDLLELGQPEQALAIGQDTLRRRRAILGENHPDTLWTASNVALAWRRLGEHQRARRLNEDTLHRRRRILGHDHPDTLRSASHLGVDLRNLGEYERSRELTEDTLRRRRRVLSPDHPDTLRSEKNLAIVQGRLLG